MHTYHIHDRIGRGGMAEIFLAIQRGLGGFERLVVFKRIAEFARIDERYVASLLREARVAATMSHPNIVTTLDVGEDDEGPYLVLEYLSGETLSWMLGELNKRKERLPLQVACHVAAAVAAALDFAHHRILPDGKPWPVVHRDVSPSNVMCCYDGQIKLLDFGVAKLAEDESKPNAVMGKPSYLTPEQVLDEPLGPLSDIFQLGIVTWEMLTGRRLFSKDVAQAVHQVTHLQIEPPSRFVSSVPPELDRLVLWALERNPRKRCPSARRFADGLQELLPNGIGSLSGRDAVRGYMVEGFPERHLRRQELERNARERPEEPAGWLDVVPSVTSSLPMFPVVQREAPSEPPRPPRREGRGLLLLVVSVSAVLMAVALGVVTIPRITPADGPPPVPAAAEEPSQVVIDAPEPADSVDDGLAEDPDPAPAPVPTAAEPPPAPKPAVRPSPQAERPAPAAPRPTRRTDNLDPWGTP